MSLGNNIRKRIYGELTKKYDALAAWETRLETEITFLRKIFEKNNVETVLDCACGTGRHVIELTKAGFNVVGSDIDPHMIKQAKQQAKSREIPATFYVSDFKQLSKNFDSTFDAVLCIGNSLSHALTKKEVRKALMEMEKMRAQDGLLVLHLRNYRKMLKEKQRFSVHRSNDDIFFYVWDYKPEYMIHIINYELKTEKTTSCSFPFHPIKKRELTRLLKDVGYQNFEFFGNFEFKAFDPEKDEWLIVVCKK